MALKIHSVKEEQTKHVFIFTAEQKQDLEYIKVFIASYFLSLYGMQKRDFDNQINDTINTCELNQMYVFEYEFQRIHKVKCIPPKEIDYGFILLRMCDIEEKIF